MDDASLTTLDDPRYCQHCGAAIVYARFREVRGALLTMYEPDYDPSDDPTTWRHMSGYAVCATSFAAPRPD